MRTIELNRLIVYLAIFLCTAFVVGVAATWCIERYLSIEKPLPKADVILVLAGGAEYKKRNYLAAKLYQQGVAPKILLTDDGLKGGWDNSVNRNPYFVEKAKWLMIDAGVPEQAIHIVGTIPSDESKWLEQGTESEAAIVREFLDANAIRSPLIITSDYHTRRALSLYTATNSSHRPTIQFGITSPERYPGLSTRKGLIFTNPPARLWLEFLKLPLV